MVRSDLCNEGSGLQGAGIWDCVEREINDHLLSFKVWGIKVMSLINEARVYERQEYSLTL